jgi:cell division protein FtsQ
LAQAALDPRSNVWLLDAGAVERRIETIPYVASARLERGFPGGARITIVERTPEACVRSDVSTATIDAQQRVLQTGCAASIVYRIRTLAEFVPGTYLHDAGVTRLQNDARALAAGGRRLTDFGLDDYGELEAALPGGILVRFGDDADLGAKERLIGPILAALGTRVATVTAIDLRSPGTPVVEHRPQPAAPPPAAVYPQRTNTI